MENLIIKLNNKYDIKTKININRKPEYGEEYDITIHLLVGDKIIGRITAHDVPLYDGEFKEDLTDSIGILAINPEYRGLNLGNTLICLLKDVYAKNKFNTKYLILSPSDNDLEKFIKSGGKFKNLHKYRTKDKFKLLQFYENVGFKLIKEQVMRVDINDLQCVVSD